MKEKITGIILAGGKNSRMGGTNKAFLQIEKERLIDKNIRILKDIFYDVILVVTNPLDYLNLDVTTVTDIIPGKGVLGGLYTGLFYCTDNYAFVTACDMPFLNADFIRYMAEKTVGYDIVVPSPTDGLQPLCAIYSRVCLPAIRASVHKDRLQIKGFYPGHKLLKIPSETLDAFDPEGRMFTNLNTPEDIEKIGAGALC